MNNLLNKPPTRSQWQICAQDVNCPGESKKRQERPRRLPKQLDDNQLSARPNSPFGRSYSDNRFQSCTRCSTIRLELSTYCYW